MTIHVLGANGMLGRYVGLYLGRKHHRVLNYGRSSFDVTTLTQREDHTISWLFKDQGHGDHMKRGDVVINCAGVIKPRIKDIGPENTIRINSLFPHVMAELCEEYGVHFIHITTDCVFSGVGEMAGKYTEKSVHDALDEYGKSKSLGEPKNCTVIRTSIIGEEKNNKRSLIEWIKSQAGKETNGYVNHLWNGITCLQFAKCVDEIIDKNLYWKGVRHVFTPQDYRKCDMVQMVSDVYGLNITVNPVVAPESCDRTLRTVEPVIFEIPLLHQQIQEMKEFKLL